MAGRVCISSKVEDNGYDKQVKVSWPQLSLSEQVRLLETYEDRGKPGIGKNSCLNSLLSVILKFKGPIVILI